MCPHDAGEPAMGSLYGKVQRVYISWRYWLRIMRNLCWMCNIALQIVFNLYQSFFRATYDTKSIWTCHLVFICPLDSVVCKHLLFALKSSIPYPLLPTRERGTNIKMFRPGRVRPDLFCFSNASGDLSSESWGKPETKKPSWHEASSGCLSIFSWKLQTTSQATIKTRYAIHQAKSAQ